MRSGRLEVKRSQANTYMRVASNYQRAGNLEGVTSIRAALELLSDKLKSLVWSWNGPRRHLTSSQKAMAYAMMYPETKRGRGAIPFLQNCKNENLTATEKVNISRARFILKHDREKAELVDSNLLLDFGNDYANIGTIQEPKWRVKTLLSKLESDRRTGTDYFSHKFMGKVQEIFAGLPKPKDPISFTNHDLPLLFTASEVQQFALDHKLNKAQTKAVDALQKAAPPR